MFDVTRDSGSVQIVFSASLENVDKACLEIRSFLVEAHIEDYSFKILLIAREALNNAVRHGNRHDSLKRVKHGFRLDRGAFVMEIEDEGEGFDWRSCLEKEPDSPCESGWGLFIMRSYATDISFNGKGNRLALRVMLD